MNGQDTASFERRFNAKVGPELPNGCHPWLGARRGGGYGDLRVAGRLIAAHRIAWQLARGPIPDGLWVLHRCDNPPCVNPDHLFLGTHEDNVADRDRKGRVATGDASGARRHPKSMVRFPSAGAKAGLSGNEVDAIRTAYAAGGVSMRALARRYGVTHHTIGRLVRDGLLESGGGW